MFELMLGMTLLVVGVLGYLRVAGEATTTGQMTAEHGVAMEAARQQLERLKCVPLADLVALYDADGANDPGGANTAPGARFQVAGLPGWRDDADGWQGSIDLPLVAGALREDVVDPGLGMPRDLNMDGAIDAADHSADCRLVPVRVRVQWDGVRGAARIELRTFLGGP